LFVSSIVTTFSSFPSFLVFLLPFQTFSFFFITLLHLLPFLVASSLGIHIMQGMPLSFSLSFFGFGFKIEAQRKK